MKWSRSVVSDSLRPRGLQPTRLSVQGIFQARALEWAGISFSRSITVSNIKILCYLNKCQRAKLTYWKGTNFPFESYSRFHSILWERDFHNQATEKVWKQCGKVAWGWEREKNEGRRVRERRQWAPSCRTEKHQTSNEDNLNVKDVIHNKKFILIMNV